MNKPQTVDEYIASFSEGQRKALEELRAIIRSTLPETTETLKWGAPATIDADGMILVVFSGHKDHMNFVGTPSTLEALRDQLTDYEVGKGSIKLSYEKPLPTELVREFVQYRANEYRLDGVKWK